MPIEKPASPASRNIYQRMIEVQKAVRSVQKNETVKMSANDRGYKAVTHDDVAAALHIPLAEAGIVLIPNVTEFRNSEFEIEKAGQNGKYIQRWYRTDLKINVRWVNADQPEDFFESQGAAFALDTSDKSFSKAYSLALKIVLLKVHLLESRDGEEERAFESGDPRAAKSGPSKSPPAKAAGKSPAAKPDAKNSTGNFAPADDSMIEQLYSLAIDRGVSEAVLNSYIKAYGIPAGGKPPVWVVGEIGKFLKNEDATEDSVQKEIQRVISRREAKRISEEEAAGKKTEGAR